MKLVVFAHTPPPHHGQSYMVRLMLEGLGGDHRFRVAGPGNVGSEVQCFHINARVSKNLEDIGGIRATKLFLLFWHCVQAVWCRIRYKAPTLYYVPAPGKKSALYRDWLVMTLCRPFFKHVVLHWHATSLSQWLETSCTTNVRAITYLLLGKADLSIALSRHNAFNAEKLWPKRIAVVPNGIPDPCGGFEKQVLPLRRERLEMRREVLNHRRPVPSIIKVLFLAHCTREKGLFDAIEAVLLANKTMRNTNAPFLFRLIVAGTFRDSAERGEFDSILKKLPDGQMIRYIGFVHGELKAKALTDSDLLCFPSHWENQPVSVIESLAFGLPPIITRLASVEEMLPAAYPGVASLKKPEDLAESLCRMIFYEDFAMLRAHFLSRYVMSSFCDNLSVALKTIS